MIECPSITFAGVGPPGLRLGEAHAAPHVPPPALLSAGVHVICVRVQYNLFSLSILLSILHINLFSMSPYGEQHSIFLSLQKK